MNENFKKVSADVSIEQLLQWRDEGLLYKAPSSEELIDKAVKEILCHVHRLDDCCTEKYAGIICNVWRKVCNRYTFRRRLVSKNGNKPSWYFVANIIYTMSLRGVYDGSLRSLVEKMDVGKCSIARNAMQDSYRMSRDEENDLKEILDTFLQCLK